MRRLILAVIVTVILPASAWAACTGASPTWTCTVGSTVAEIQACINGATAGDTINIGAGSATWSSGLSLNKRLIVQGAGIDQTTITAASSGQSIFVITADSVQVTGLTIAGGGKVWAQSGRGWRIHHMKFTGTDFFAGVSATGLSRTTEPRGLVDNCTFINSRVEAVGTAEVGAGMIGLTLHGQPLALGTDEFIVYVEDSTFVQSTLASLGNAVDCNYSGSYVFRHNVVTDSYLEAHSVQAVHRACRKWEIYDNIIQQVSKGIYRSFLIRGGTGVIFDNTVTGGYTDSRIHIDNVRSYADAGGEAGRCNGASTWDGNIEAGGYWCRDQIGRGPDVSIWTTAPYPAQPLEPMYAWGNTFNGSPMSIYVANGADIHIKPNRDYYDGVGIRPGYTPYTYPHPLQGGATPPNAPTNVRIR